MKRLLVVFVTVVAVFSTQSVEAAPTASACVGGSFTTEDLAGTYISQPNRMALVVEPCGMLWLTWDNADGRHRASYVAVQRLLGGGVVAEGFRNDGWFLDDQTAIGVAPAEPGWLTVMTISAYATELRVYRLGQVR